MTKPLSGYLRPVVGTLLVAGWLAFGPAAFADVFDNQSPSDDTTATENELVHKSLQTHDLAAHGGNADVDYYRFSAQPYSSYEVIVDATSAEIAPVVLELRTSANAPHQTATGASAIGYTRVLRFWNDTDAAVEYFVKVSSTTCTTTCTSAATYRIRLYDTTYTIPRFYDHAAVRTTLFFQNANDYGISGKIYYWLDQPGAATPSPFVQDLKTIAGFNTPLLPLELEIKTPATELVDCQPDHTGCSGFITVITDGGYGELNGKASQYDPTTGDPGSWDWQMDPKP